MRFAREYVDRRRAFAPLPERAERLRDLAAAALRDGFFFAALGRERVAALRDLATGRGFALFAGALVVPKAFFTVLFAARTGDRPLAAAFPASAPTTPPMIAPAGPTMLPIAAPATAPAVSFGIGGISMFSAAGGPPLCCVSGSSAINNKLLRSCFKAESHGTATTAVPLCGIRQQGSG